MEAGTDIDRQKYRKKKDRGGGGRETDRSRTYLRYILFFGQIHGGYTWWPWRCMGWLGIPFHSGCCTRILLFVHRAFPREGSLHLGYPLQFSVLLRQCLHGKGCLCLRYARESFRSQSSLRLHSALLLKWRYETMQHSVFSSSSESKQDIPLHPHLEERILFVSGLHTEIEVSKDP